MPSSRRWRSTRPALDRWRLQEQSRIDRRLAFNRLVVTFGCLLTVASALALPTLLRTQRGLGDPEPIAQVPPDDPGRGLVYAGLVAAKRGAPCAGAYEVAGAQGCTYGPDEPPPGLDVKQTVAPVAPAIRTRPLAIRAPGVAPAESDLLADVMPAGAVPAVSPDAAPEAAAFIFETHRASRATTTAGPAPGCRSCTRTRPAPPADMSSTWRRSGFGPRERMPSSTGGTVPLGTALPGTTPRATAPPGARPDRDNFGSSRLGDAR